MILDGQFSEKLDFYTENYKTLEARMSLHPIDRLVLINGRNSSITYRWMAALRSIGIDYTTPCIMLTNTRDMNCLNNINNILLIVSINAYLLASNNETLSRTGKLASIPEFRRDKNHIETGRILFTGKITRKDYAYNVYNKN